MQNRTFVFPHYRIDFALVITFLILLGFGVLTIYSAENPGSTTKIMERQFVKQIYWISIGMILFILVGAINYQKIEKYSIVVYIIIVLLLLLTLAIGTRVRGSKSWISITGSIGFQPSEFAKLGVILGLARYLEQKGAEIKSLTNFLLGLGIGLFPAGLILLQPDFGTALVYIPITLVMLYFGGARLSHIISVLIILGISIVIPLLTTFIRLTNPTTPSFVLLLEDTKIIFILSAVFGILSFLTYIFYRITRKEIIYRATVIFLIFFVGLILSALFTKELKPYQKERLIVFLKPTIDPFGAGYNIIQSKIAVGSGGLFGKGLRGGTQSQLGFLPEKTTDFIFSIFAEEWGFVGSFFLISIYGIFIYRNIMILYNARDAFATLVASGILGMFLFHIIINIGMTIGIMPITGIPLPFMSYGGSFVITSIIATSLLFNIEMRRYLR